jgi:hypothetical protein
MPKIPQLETGTPAFRQTGAVVQADTSVERASAAQGRAIQQFGRDIQSVTQGLAKASQRAQALQQQQFLDQTTNAARLADAESASFSQTSGQADFSDPNGKNFQDVYSEDYTKKRDAFLNEIDDEELRGAAAARWDNFSSRRAEKLLAASVAARGQQIQENYNQDLNQNLAAISQDPAAFEEVAAGWEAKIDRDRDAIGDKVASKLLSTGNQALADQFIQGFINKKTPQGFREAREALNNRRVSKQMDAKERQQWQVTIDQRERQFYADLWNTETREETRQERKKKESSQKSYEDLLQMLQVSDDLDDDDRVMRIADELHAAGKLSRADRNSLDRHADEINTSIDNKTFDRHLSDWITGSKTPDQIRSDVKQDLSNKKISGQRAQLIQQYMRQVTNKNSSKIQGRRITNAAGLIKDFYKLNVLNGEFELSDQDKINVRQDVDNLFVQMREKPDGNPQIIAQKILAQRRRITVRSVKGVRLDSMEQVQEHKKKLARNFRASSQSPEVIANYKLALEQISVVEASLKADLGDEK